jgi:feruloyl-CoA synthase
MPEETRKAFDEEGYYRLGDALRLADANDIGKGLYFDGRVAEDFKLATGTWVAVGPLRTAFIDHFAPYVQDVVIAGLDREFIGALVFLDVEHCRALCASPSATAGQLAADRMLRGMLQERLASFAARATGSSTRVERLLVVAAPPSIDSAEMTDKGSLNQRAVLDNRRALVERLFASACDDDVIMAPHAHERQG